MTKYYYMDIRIHKNSVIAFDLDDTLFKEFNYLRSAFKAIARNLEPDHWGKIYQHMLLQFEDQKDVFGELVLSHSAVKKDLIEYYRNHIPDINPEENAPRLMEKIKEKGGKVGIITDGRSITQNNKIDQLGIRRFLDFLIISEDTGYDKNASHNFELLRQMYPKGEFTYIADNPQKDFYHPNLMGWNTIGVLDDGNNIHKQKIEDLKMNYNPDHWIQELNEIVVT